MDRFTRYGERVDVRVNNWIGDSLPATVRCVAESFESIEQGH